LLWKGGVLAVGGAAVQFVLTFIPPIGGVSPIADAARTIAVGFIGSVAMKKTGILRTYADDVLLAAATLAGGKIVSAILLPFALRLFPQRQARMPETQEQKAMNGIAALYPGLNPYGAYTNGLGGIAMIDPAMQPYGGYGI
jgi:hypothetical protein